nr:OPT/YSL family transporter [Oceanococcus sp. HetDA_MAG_MS8]
MSAQHQPQLTARALMTGVVLGLILTPCNVYSGLKIGWSFNMSIAAALLSLGFWRLAQQLCGSAEWGLYENNINQTTASAAASIISGGLVAPIPAWTLLTGQTLPITWLVLWVFTVSALGIGVAASLRRSLIIEQKLRFPAGVATAETITQIYRGGRAAVLKLRALVAALLIAAGNSWAQSLGLGLARWSPPGTGLHGLSLQKLGIALDPSLLMLGFGAIIGWRAGLSLLLGALLAWGLLAPEVIRRGWVQASPDAELWFGPLVEWLLWPGVTLMVVSSLGSFLLYLATNSPTKIRQGEPAAPRSDLSRSWMVGGFVLAAIAAVILQQHLFGIRWWAATAGVTMSFGLAVVAARVVGETGIPPIGAIGKVAQLGFGAIAPGSVSSNLMGANVTGGAAGQSADLLNDLKTGYAIGACPQSQILAQTLGILCGSVVGSLSYLVLIPDPHTQLLSAQWPAPAVATWKAVAEVLAGGWEALPPHAATASASAAVVAVALLVLQKRLGPTAQAWLPSGPALGLAFVIPAWISVGMFTGAALALFFARVAPAHARSYTLPVAAGLVAGESLAGVGHAAWALLG